MAQKPPTAETDRQIYFEFQTLGVQVRVAAIDSETGVEVIIIAPKTASQIQMQTIAKAKLERRLAQLAQS